MLLGWTENPLVSGHDSSGNPSFAATSDPYVAGYSQGNLNGSLNPPGIGCAGLSSATVTNNGVSTSTPFWSYYRYVLLNPTTPPSSYVVGPVYWKDESLQVVTSTMSDSVTGKANSLAGMLLNAQTTASVISNSWVWIKVGGFHPAAPVPASTVVDDVLIGATGDNTWARVAAGTAPTNKPGAIALTNRTGGGLSDLLICIEGGYNW